MLAFFYVDYPPHRLCSEKLIDIILYQSIIILVETVSSLHDYSDPEDDYVRY